MRTKLMAGVVMLALPTGVLAADEATSDTGVAQPQNQTTASNLPAPQGPFFSRRMMPNGGTGNFPPMGFDPMANGNATAPSESAAPQPAYPGNVYGNRMGNNAGGNVGGGSEVDVQVRGRINMGGRGSGNGFGNNGWGNNFMHGVPYGMPYGQGYGAPYGTPFGQAYNAPQYAPQATPQAAAPAENADAPQVQTAQPQAPQQPNYPAPFSWSPQGMGMPNPGGFFSQRQQQKHTQGMGQPPAQAMGNATQMPAQPEEPQWVKDRREEAAKRQAEAQKRFAEMQRTNPYAQQGYGRGYGQPYGQGYGAPYGAPYGYAPQAPAAPSAPSDSPDAK